VAAVACGGSFSDIAPALQRDRTRIYHIVDAENGSRYRRVADRWWR
jgi:hypothetical protein